MQEQEVINLYSCNLRKHFHTIRNNHISVT